MKQIILLFLFLVFVTPLLIAQPILNSSQNIAGYRVYGDLLNPQKYYFSPSQLKLAYQSNGRPEAQFLSLSYSGNFVNGDQNELRHTNILYFTVEQDLITQEHLEEIKNTLNIKGLDLSLMPITNLKTTIISALPDGRYLKLGNNGSFDAPNESGKQTASNYWTKRSFTLRLDNHQAEILLSSFKEGILPISLSYSFYSDVIIDNRGQIEITGDTLATQEIANVVKELTILDSVPKKHLILTDVVSFPLDTTKWKDLVIKKHIGKGFPPSWPILEVRCYDFNQQLRPDLFLKNIELKAIGLNGRPVILRRKRFLSTNPDLYTMQIRFPYAVRMDKPLAYRVTTYTPNGNRTQTDWVELDSWSTLIDITTPLDDNNIGQLSMTIETAPKEWQDSSLKKVKILIGYELGNLKQELWTAIALEDELPIQNLHFHYNKASPVYYQTIWEKKDGSIIKGIPKFLGQEERDVYLFLPQINTD